MSYEFKNLNEVEHLEALTENTTVMGFEGGKPVQMPASELGGKGLIFEIGADEYSQTNDEQFTVTKNYDPLYEALMAGKTAYIAMNTGNGVVHMNPFAWAVTPDVGFMVRVAIDASFILYFTNGSYHGAATTE